MSISRAIEKLNVKDCINKQAQVNKYEVWSRVKKNVSLSIKAEQIISVKE